MTSLPDKERLEEIRLIKRAKNGDDSAFEALLNKYNRPILNYCYRLVGNAVLSQDLAQESFVKAFMNIASFDIDKKFSPWIYRIAHNLCVDYLRKKKIMTSPLQYEGTDGEAVSVDIADSTASPEVLLERKEILHHFEEALGQIPTIYKEPLVLRHQQQKTYQEISEILDTPIGTIKARIHRGRGMLKELLVQYV